MANKYITALLIALFVGGGLYYYERPSAVGNNTLVYLGDSVYIEDERVFINVTPHSLVGDGDVITELELKNLSTVPALTMLFGYNSEIVTPSNPRVYNPRNVTREENYTCQGTFNYTTSPKHFWCYVNNTLVFEHSFDRGNIPTKTAFWNVTEMVDWQPINKPSGMIKRDFNGKNTWRYISNIEGLQSDVRYRIKVSLTAPALPIGKTQEQAYPGYDPKYDIAFMPSSYGSDVAAAIADGNFYIIDPTYNLSSKLLAYWSFNETSTASYDAVSNNSASWNSISSVAGIVGNGVSPSSATSYMTVETPARFNNMVNGTMCFWLNQTSLFRAYTYIVSFDGGYPNIFATLGQWSGNASQLAYAYGNYWPTSGVEYATYFGKWTHICQVMDDTNDFTTLYANGVPIGNYSGPIALGDTVSLVYFLGQSGYSRAVIGSFDELGIWNRTLSYDEINYLYNGNSGAPCVYPFSCEAASPGAVYWQQNITNITANHNGTPYIYSVKFNLTNSSTGCFATNITSNDSSHPIDNATGWFNLSGANISATGVSWVKITGIDNCSNNVTQTFYVNITNTAPYNDAKDNNRTFNHNESLTVGTFCGDADNDALTYSMNDTAFSIYNGGIDYDPPTITAVGVHYILFGCSDGLINTTGVVRFNVTNTAPSNNWTNNNITNSAASPFTTSNYCRDLDRDTLHYSVNNTVFSMLSNGSMNYNGLGAEGTYSVAVSCSDLNINTTAVTTVFLTGANVGNASTITLCGGVTSLSIPINPNHKNLSDNKYYGSTLVRGTGVCTLNLSTTNETLPIRFNASTNASSANSSVRLTVNGVNYTLNSTSRNLFNLTPNTTTLINVSGVYYNYTGLTPFNAKLMIRLWG